ncbi:DUF6457 domain-containing protein [Luethyella okanaganae]|uniref:DUF6457 domain-containing protein n=1 Tax=Luethyella okanaganae TaxID=69372 RepID=A0ABW1V9N6_9MICO
MMNDASHTREPTRENTPLPPEALDAWLAVLAAKLGLDPACVPTGTILDVARDVAHGVARPAAPLSTFLIGLAAGASGGNEAAIRKASRIVTEAARDWAPVEDTTTR